MKKIILSTLLLTALYSCKKETPSTVQNVTPVEQSPERGW
jgi:hypothetical protein